MKTLRLKALMILLSIFSTTFIFMYQLAFAGTLTNVLDMPASNVVQETALHVNQFTTATTGTIKTINMVYPAGFVVSGVKLVEVTNIGAGTLSVSGQTVTYTVTSAVSVGSGVVIKIKVANIVNATTLSNTITVTTKTSGGSTIDTGTSAAFILTQVNSGMIANGAVGNTQLGANAVNSSNIVDGSVISADIADGTVAAVDLAANSVDSTKILDGSVTNTKIAAAAVDSTKVNFNYAGSASKGGPASDLSCTACVSQSELDFTVPTSPAHRVVVATSGGDYTTISAALAAISPTAADPYVIDVMPGTYIEYITMKSYVHLRGAGREVTTIQAPASTGTNIALPPASTNIGISGLTITNGSIGIDVNTASNVTIQTSSISGYTAIGVGPGNNPAWNLNIEITGNIISGGGGSGMDGIFVDNSSPMIRANKISGYNGIYLFGTGSPMISGNTITGCTYGIRDDYTSSPTITENTITGCLNAGIRTGFGSTVFTIKGNIITGNGTPFDNGGGIIATNSPVIIQNKITNNAPLDLYVGSTTAPNVSFNVYDVITGTTAVGSYNIKSNGTPW